MISYRFEFMLFRFSLKTFSVLRVRCYILCIDLKRVRVEQKYQNQQKQIENGNGNVSKRQHTDKRAEHRCQSNNKLTTIFFIKIMLKVENGDNIPKAERKKE